MDSTTNSKLLTIQQFQLETGLSDQAVIAYLSLPGLNTGRNELEQLTVEVTADAPERARDRLRQLNRYLPELEAAELRDEASDFLRSAVEDVVSEAVRRLEATKR